MAKVLRPAVGSMGARRESNNELPPEDPDFQGGSAIMLSWDELDEWTQQHMYDEELPPEDADEARKAEDIRIGMETWGDSFVDLDAETQQLLLDELRRPPDEVQLY